MRTNPAPLQHPTSAWSEQIVRVKIALVSGIVASLLLVLMVLVGLAGGTVWLLS